MKENSSVCELVTRDPTWHPGYHDIYDVATDLYKLKDELEDFLCRRTDSLFDIANKVILFDLTNFFL